MVVLLQLNEPVRSYEIILPLLQLIALTLPVLAILTQVVVRGMVLEGGVETAWSWVAMSGIAVTAVLLLMAASELAGELTRLVEQDAIVTATSTLVVAFGFLAITIMALIPEFYHMMADTTESSNTAGDQASLTDYEADEQ